jgi:hypothetical protein
MNKRTDPVETERPTRTEEHPRIPAKHRPAKSRRCRCRQLRSLLRAPGSDRCSRSVSARRLQLSLRGVDIQRGESFIPGRTCPIEHNAFHSSCVHSGASWRRRGRGQTLSSTKAAAKASAWQVSSSSSSGYQMPESTGRIRRRANDGLCARHGGFSGTWILKLPLWNRG